jgi:hypothetical protein
VSTLEVERVQFRRVSPSARDAVSKRATQFWDVVGEDGAAIGHAEVFEKPDQWGVRLFDRAPHIDDSDLVRVVAKLLVWHAGCKVETVELWLARNNSRQVMVRVTGDYV